jgi:hypothetical protein
VRHPGVGSLIQSPATNLHRSLTMQKERSRFILVHAFKESGVVKPVILNTLDLRSATPWDAVPLDDIEDPQQRAWTRQWTADLKSAGVRTILTYPNVNSRTPLAGHMMDMFVTESVDELAVVLGVPTFFAATPAGLDALAAQAGED